MSTEGAMTAPATTLLGWRMIVKLDDEPPTTLKLFVVSEVRPALATVKAYGPPARVKDRSLKVATPLTQFCVFVPSIWALAGAVARLSVTGALDVFTTPRLSSRLTVTAGFMIAPATTVVGCWLMTMDVGVRLPMLKDVLVSGIMLGDEA